VIETSRAGYAQAMNGTQRQPRDHEPDAVDPDGDPEMKQSAKQPDQAEGDDDPAKTQTP
jgi:hypothetical protein